MESFENSAPLPETSVGKSDFLQSDPAIKSFLSKEVKNSEEVFHDYAPTRALIRASIEDTMKMLGMKR